jgi:hypothetical protein
MTKNFSFLPIEICPIEGRQKLQNVHKSSYQIFYWENSQWEKIQSYRNRAGQNSAEERKDLVNWSWRKEISPNISGQKWSHNIERKVIHIASVVNSVHEKLILITMETLAPKQCRKKARVLAQSCLPVLRYFVDFWIANCQNGDSQIADI